MKKLEIAALKFQQALNSVFPHNKKHLFSSAIITAAGSGTRMGGVSKQFLPINGIPCVAYSLIAFEKCGEIDEIVVVAKENEKEEMKRIAKEYSISKLKRVVSGGSTRQESVANGFSAVSEKSDLVAIHDGARPLIRPEDITLLLDNAKRYGASCAARRVSDTVKRAKNENFILETLPRDDLYTVETPQVFKTDLYRISLAIGKKSGAQVTDDCSLVENAGFDIKLCDPGHLNIKLTTPGDLEVAERFLKEDTMTDLRIGHGYDVHRLVEGRKLFLGTVHIPFEKGLLGHSDADVLCHAIADAMLGACGLGDIGRHFPDHDPNYEGVSGKFILGKALAICEEKGFCVSNVDAVIVAQKPKLAFYIDIMRENMASVLKISSDRINVKATTEEKMGFTGREEGISAHAVCIMKTNG